MMVRRGVWVPYHHHPLYSAMVGAWNPWKSMVAVGISYQCIIAAPPCRFPYGMVEALTSRHNTQWVVPFADSMDHQPQPWWGKCYRPKKNDDQPRFSPSLTTINQHSNYDYHQPSSTTLSSVLTRPATRGARTGARRRKWRPTWGWVRRWGVAPGGSTQVARPTLEWLWNNYSIGELVNWWFMVNMNG